MAPHLIRWICVLTSIQKVAGPSSAPNPGDPWLSSAYDGVVSWLRQLGEIEPEIDEPFGGWWFEVFFELSSLALDDSQWIGFFEGGGSMCRNEKSPMERRISPNFDQLCLSLECNSGIRGGRCCDLQVEDMLVQTLEKQQAINKNNDPAASYPHSRCIHEVYSQ
jgi:hypothetical protein